MKMYTVKIEELGNGVETKVEHFDNLEDAIRLVKQFAKTGQFSATIWQYDGFQIKQYGISR